MLTSWLKSAVEAENAAKIRAVKKNILKEDIVFIFVRTCGCVFGGFGEECEEERRRERAIYSGRE